VTALDPTRLGTLVDLFRARVKTTPIRFAYRQYDAAQEAWVAYTWSQVANDVRCWQAALAAEGLVPGDRVAIMLKNCVDWVAFDQAAMGLGLVTVPLYLDDRPDNAAWIIEHAEAKVLLVEGKFQYRKLAELAAAAPGLKRIVGIAAPEAGETLDPRFVVAADWIAQHEQEPVPERTVAPETLASIVYTSGTTGRPKGVMLSHDNLLYNAVAASRCGDFEENEVFLSFLPLSHTLERTGGLILPMLLGAEVAYSRGVAQLAEDLQIIRPTVLVSVPRIYERVYARIQDGLAKKKPLAKKLFDYAVQVGWQRFEQKQGRAPWHSRLLLWPLLDALVAHKVTERLGGRLRFAVSGGAALSPVIARTFVGLGVPVYQGYGLTEASPVVCVNTPRSNLPASIGRPMPGIGVKIGADHELLTRSRSVMRGYWKDEAATQAMIDDEGWLHTGDQAKCDAHGHYFITGRIKDILVLSNGEKVPPADMEAAVQLDPLFEQVMVVGEGRPCLGALAVLNPDQWLVFAGELGVPATPASLAEPKVTKALAQRVAARLKGFPGYAQVRRVAATLEPWSVENGLMTPTLKLKRNRVIEHHATEIDTMYADFARC